MKNFLLLSAIYLFSPLPSSAEQVDGLRRVLITKLPEGGVGEIRRHMVVQVSALLRTQTRSPAAGGKV